MGNMSGGMLMGANTMVPGNIGGQMAGHMTSFGGMPGQMPYNNQVPTVMPMHGTMPANSMRGLGAMRPAYPNLQPPGYTTEMAEQFKAKHE